MRISDMLSVEHRLAIQELVARFAHCSDYGDWAGMEQIYMPGIVTELDGLPIKYEGIPAQIEHAKESDRQAGGKNRHYHFNLVVEEQGGDVFAHYFVVNVNAGSAPMTAQIVVTGRHRDRVVKTESGWKFAHRFITFDQSFDLNF